MEPPLLASRARHLNAARCRRAVRRLVGPLRAVRLALADGGGGDRGGGGGRGRGRGVGEAPPTPPPTPAPGAGGAVRAREEERVRARERQRQREGGVRPPAGRFAVLEAVAEVRAALREVRQMREARG